MLPTQYTVIFLPHTFFAASSVSKPAIYSDRFTAFIFYCFVSNWTSVACWGVWIISAVKKINADELSLPTVISSARAISSYIYLFHKHFPLYFHKGHSRRDHRSEQLSCWAWRPWTQGKAAMWTICMFSVRGKPAYNGIGQNAGMHLWSTSHFQLKIYACQINLKPSGAEPSTPISRLIPCRQRLATKWTFR